MKPWELGWSGTEDMFRQRLENLIDLRHPLVRLAGEMDWQVFSDSFGSLYDAEHGRPGLPVRLLVGLHYLKHAFDLSDEEVVLNWVENPYWQYCCGEEYFQHRLPLDGSQMSRFRQRIGVSGCELMLQLTVVTGVATKTVTERSLTQVTGGHDGAGEGSGVPDGGAAVSQGAGVIGAAGAAPWAQLATELCAGGEAGVVPASALSGGPAESPGTARVEEVESVLGPCFRDIKRQATVAAVESPELHELLERVERLLAQRREDSHKRYGVHAPEVECIAKGKAPKKYECGVKVSVATSTRSNFVVGMRSLPGNPYDGHTLSASLDQVARLTGVRPLECFVDRGYRGHDETDTTVVIAGQQRGMTPRLKRLLKRCNAIEPVIGHMKADGRLNRNYLKGVAGDAMNALLVGAGHNLRLILRQLRLLFAWRLGPVCGPTITAATPARAYAA